MAHCDKGIGESKWDVETVKPGLERSRLRAAGPGSLPSHWSTRIQWRMSGVPRAPQTQPGLAFPACPLRRLRSQFKPQFHCERLRGSPLLERSAGAQLLGLL